MCCRHGILRISAWENGVLLDLPRCPGGRAFASRLEPVAAPRRSPEFFRLLNHVGGITCCAEASAVAVLTNHRRHQKRICRPSHHFLQSIICARRNLSRKPTAGPLHHCSTRHRRGAPILQARYTPLGFASVQSSADFLDFSAVRDGPSQAARFPLQFSIHFEKTG